MLHKQEVEASICSVFHCNFIASGLHCAAFLSIALYTLHTVTVLACCPNSPLPWFVTTYPQKLADMCPIFISA